MRIKEARIFNFGKLQNVKYRFGEGINVIYGGNEQGKTTLHQFLLGMLFGMEKGRGRTAKDDAYSRYQPWQAPSFYSGALRFLAGKQSFYLERNFYAKERSEYLRNEADGEELSVEYGDLEVLLGGIGREEFGNTYDIPQSGAVTGKAMAELLTGYLAEAEAGSDGRVHVLKAGTKLLAKRNELRGRLKELVAKREDFLEKCQLQANLLQKNVIELKAQVKTFERRQADIAESLKIQQEQKRKKAKVCVFLAIPMIGAAVGLWLYGYKTGAISAGCVALLLLGLAPLFWRPVNRELLLHAEEMLSQMKENLQDAENELLNLQEEMQELEKTSVEEEELSEDIKALELAKSELEQLSQEYYMEVADELNAEISGWIALLTKNTYDNARLDKDGRLRIVADHREVEPEALSRGTLEQIYLALRLAAGSVLMKNEEMPVFLDEAFAMYDDVRLKETLSALEKTGKQIFIFTCQKREEEILTIENIPYHLIKM